MLPSVLQKFKISHLQFISGILAILFFYPYLSVGHHTFDDIRQSMVTFDEMMHYGQIQGRLPLLSLMGLTSVWVHKIDSLAAVKLILMLGVLSNIFIFAYLGSRMYSGKGILWFIFPIVILLLPDNWDHSQVAAGPLVGTIPLTLFIWSLIWFNDTLAAENPRKFLGSAALYLLALQFGESFVVLSMAYFLLALLNAQTPKIRFIVAKTRGIIIVSLVYVTAYGIYRYYHPSSYDGNKVSWATLSVSSFLETLWQFSIGTMPLLSFQDGFMRDYLRVPVTLYHGIGIWETFTLIIKNFRDISPVWIVQGLFGIYIFQIFKDKISVRNRTLLFGVIGICLVVIFGSNLLIALSIQYQSWVKQGAQRYVGSYYSYFGWVILLFAAYLLIRDLIPNRIVRRVYQAALSGVLFFAIFMNSFANDSIVESKKASQARTRLVFKLILSEQFQKIPENSAIFAPDLFFQLIRIDAPPFTYWDRYLKKKTGKKYNVFSTWAECEKFVSENRGTNIYNISLRSEPGRGPQHLIFSPLKKLIPEAVVFHGKSADSILADTAAIFPLDERFPGSIIFSSDAGLTSRTSFARVVPATISASNIRIESILLSRQPTIEPPFSVSHREGFFEQEFDGNRTFFWSKRESKLQVYNPYGTAKRATLSAFVALPFLKDKRLNVQNHQFSIAEAGSAITHDLLLKPGLNMIPVWAESKKMDARPKGTDTRDLYFQIFDARLKLLD